MFKNLTGFRDFYPEQCQLRNYLFQKWRQVAVTTNFREYDAPSLESLDLYREKSGEEILSQLYYFEDKGGRTVGLRPEITPSVARMVGSRANTLKKPIKWYNIGECFRYERPQKGRLRSFYQFNADIFGESSIYADVELISLLIHSLKIFGLSERDFRIRLSDRNMWGLLLNAIGIDSNKTKEVLALVDKYEKLTEKDWEQKTNLLLGTEKALSFRNTLKEWLALKTVVDLEQFWRCSHLSNSLQKEVSKRLEDWHNLVEALNHLGVGEFLELDFTIVRGLAYYTGFVFEAFDYEQKSRALAGGGRYDQLVTKLGGPDIPATGFAVGDVTLQDFLGSKNLLPSYFQHPDVYVVIDGDKMLPNALLGISSLRSKGISVEYSFKKISLTKQFKGANSCGANWVLIYGAKEWIEGKVTLKNTSSARQNVVIPNIAFDYIASRNM